MQPQHLTRRWVCRCPERRKTRDSQRNLLHPVQTWIISTSGLATAPWGIPVYFSSTSIGLPGIEPSAFDQPDSPPNHLLMFRWRFDVSILASKRLRRTTSKAFDMSTLGPAAVEFFVRRMASAVSIGVNGMYERSSGLLILTFQKISRDSLLGLWVEIASVYHDNSDND